jgi:hypothetical protein
MNNEAGGHPDAPMPPVNAAAKPGAGRNWRTIEISSSLPSMLKNTKPTPASKPFSQKELLAGVKVVLRRRMRFNTFWRVDFPQLEGPIMAVIGSGKTALSHFAAGMA